MTYTLGQAAKAAGRSKPTIARAIKSGRLSASRTETGEFAIDPARVAGPVVFLAIGFFTSVN